ncbi:hypothetical protein [Mesorhizobium sp. M0088]|uniref:hypothetical protein n=1 Tax=Mesorhizobium sp. M0088 TaxID=2956873 RepID=UPI003336A70F
MAEILDFELGSSRLRVKRAEKSLKRAKEETDRKNGVVNPRHPCAAGRGKARAVRPAHPRSFFLEV